MQKIGIEEKILYKGTKILEGDASAAILNLGAGGSGLELPQLPGASERYLVFDAEVLEDHSVSMVLVVRVKDEPEDDVVSHGVRFGLMPRLRAKICIDLKWLDGHILFPGHTEGQLKVVCIGGRVLPEEIRHISLETLPCFHDWKLRIANISLTDKRPESFPIPDGKLIDELGQYKPKEWKGKIHSVAELREKLQKALAVPDSFTVKDWSQYGGWKNKKLTEGSGFFSKVKQDGRWWLADPEGYAFFSTGTDCVRAGADCRIDGVEKLLDWLPSRDDPDYKDMFGTGNAHGEMECRPDPVLFSYEQANLFRAFGRDWYPKWQELMSRQIKANGMNTIGNWSDERLWGKVTLPYVMPLKRFPETKKFIFRDFPDVLSDEYAADAKVCAKYLESFVDDPRLIGYFLRNEPNWAFVNDLVIADEVLYNSEASVCKDRLIAFLSDKYKTAENLSMAWNHQFSSFDDLRKPVQNASTFSAKASGDMHEFSRIMINAYVSIPSRACREIDTHHMNLGMRWAWISDPDVVSGWENFDVFSINCYQPDPTAALDHVVDLGVDLPIMIGEFHFGALDAGLPATGLRGVTSQKERGKAFRYYCERVAAHPYGAGCHWFQCYDQFPLGRFDGENYNIGLFDICSLPQEEMMSAVRACADVLYPVAAGAVKPYQEEVQFIPMIAY